MHIASDAVKGCTPPLPAPLNFNVDEAALCATCEIYSEQTSFQNASYANNIEIEGGGGENKY